MLSSPKTKYPRVANVKSTTKCKLVKGISPLKNFRFYLDIEQHTISSKVETKIQELGGSIVFFLVEEVTHFITDKIEKDNINIITNSPNTTQYPTVQTPQSDNISRTSPNVNNCNFDFKATIAKYTTRADAMLQRVRIHSYENNNTSQQSSIQIAKKWDIPIWTAEYALKYFEKIITTLKIESSHLINSSKHHKQRATKLNQVNHLKGNFIKIEAFVKQYRPFYKQLSYWPYINLEAGVTGTSPFNNSEIKTGLIIKGKKTSKNSNIMTRKSRTTKQVRVKSEVKETSEKQCGYCELCRVEYDVLKLHLKTDVHINFSKNDNNFIAIDTLINSHSSVGNFLKINETANKNSTENACELFEKRATKKKLIKDYDIKSDIINKIAPEFTPEINGGSNTDYQKICIRPKTRRSNSVQNIIPTDINIDNCGNQKGLIHCEDNIVALESKIEVGPNLRSKRETCKKINYSEPKEDDENADNIKNKLKIRGIRWRAPSPQNRPTIPTAMLYKVIDEKKSSQQQQQLSQQQQPVDNINKMNLDKKEPLSEKNKETPSGLIVKFKRVRQSELSLLSDEAENFMFPKREVSDCDTDEDRQTTSEPADISQEISSELDDSRVLIKQEPMDQDGDDIYKDMQLPPRRRRRRKDLEAFLDENSEYYKFKNPSSRLRFQETPTQPILNTTLGIPNIDLTNLNEDQCCKKKESSNPNGEEDGVGVMKWSNGQLITNEQVESHKFAFERVPSTEPWFLAFQRQDEGTEKIFEYYGSTDYKTLPYEMGPLPPLKTNCCILNVNKIQNFKLSPKKLNQRKKDGEHKEIGDNCENKREKSEKKTSSRKKKLFSDIVGRPRKSPREHASTLAILSSLVQQRRKRDRELNENIDSIDNGDITILNNNCHLDTIKEETDFESESKKNDANVDYLTRELENTFTDAFIDDLVDINIPEGALLSFNKDNDLIALVESYVSESSTLGDLDFNYSKKDIFDNKKLSKVEALMLARSAKKRKNNRTGWPNKKRVTTIKKEKDEGIGSSVENESDRINDEKTAVDLSNCFQKSTDEVFITSQSKVFCEENHNKRCTTPVSIPYESSIIKDGFNNLLCTSSSEKTENSDIFTVSSDSLDTSATDITEIKNDKDVDSISSKSIFVSDDLESSSLTFDIQDNSIIHVNSDAVVIDDNNKNKECVGTLITYVKNDNDILGSSDDIHNDVSPIKKLNVSPSSYGLRSTSKSRCGKRQSSKRNSTSKIAAAVTTPTLPKSPRSPRKLRKPRGRWYRER